MSVIDTNFNLSMEASFFEESETPPRKRNRLSLDFSDKEVAVDILTQLERELEALPLDQYNYDLLTRIEEYRKDRLQTLVEPAIWGFVTCFFNFFQTSESVRIENLYKKVLTRHLPQKDFFTYFKALCDEAVKKHDSQRIAFLSRSISPDQRGMLLLYAAKNGYLEVVQAIFESGSVNISEQNRASSVFEAAEQGFSEIVRILLSGGSIDNWNKIAALEVAIEKGYIDVVRVMLESQTITRQERNNLLSISRGNQGIIALLNTVHDHNPQHSEVSFELSFEQVLSNPVAFLDKVEKEGFPEEIDLLDSKGEHVGVADLGGVRKGFVTKLFKALQYKLNLQSDSIPSAETEEQKQLYKKIGTFLSILMKVNIEQEESFLINTFVHPNFYKILQIIAKEQTFEDQQKSVAKILLETNPMFEQLSNAILNPDDEKALKAYAETSYCLLKSIDEWNSTTDQAETLKAAKDVLESYIVAARCLLEGASEDLKETISMEDPQELAILFQGYPITNQALLEALSLPDSRSALLTQQLGWLKEKILVSDVEWCKRFVKWATEKECIAIEGKILLEQSHENLMAHTCSNTIDIPSALDNREDFLAALDSVLDGELNSV